MVLRVQINFQIFPEVKLSEEGNFELDFFVHGVRYVSKSSRQRIRELEVGDKLLLMKDFQNETDKFALAIRTTNSSPEILGYCPRFLASGLSDIMDSETHLELSVAKVNLDAPLYYQLMCKLSVSTTDSKLLFDGEEFQVISSQ